MSGPMDPERLADAKALAGMSMSGEAGRWRAHASPGSMDVSVFVDGCHAGAIIRDVGGRVRATMLAFDGHDLREVLDHADHWEATYQDGLEANLELCAEVKRLNAALVESEAKAKRYRSRCPVTAEDVEAAGVTWAQCEAWLDIRLTRFDRGTRVDWKQQSTWVCTTGHGWDMAGAINIVAKHFSLDQWDILGEMAALTPEASP